MKAYCASLENPRSTTEDIFILGDFLAAKEGEGYSVLLQSKELQTSKRWKFNQKLF